MSKQNFTHLILTRFNLKRLEGNPPARGWLERRFDLFDRFCYPSLRTQSNDNFTWLVFFDTDTPQAFRGRIEEYARWKKFIPVFTGSEIFFGFHFPPELRPTILNHIDDHCRFLITSRLDNDDAVHKDYVQMIQKSFDRQKLEAVNLLYGWQLYRKKLILCQIESNPFISLIEEFDESTIRTVYVRGHGMISQICPVKNIVNKTKPAWMQVIHYDNRVNRRMSGPQYPIRELMNGYEFYFDPDNVLKNKRLPELFDKTLQQIRMGGHFSRGAKRKAKKDPEKFRQFTEEFYKHTDSIDELRRLIRDFKKS
jgi:hypothetical protein